MASNPRFAGNNKNRSADQEARLRIAERRQGFPNGSPLRPVEDVNNASQKYLEKSRFHKANQIGNQPVPPQINAADRDLQRRAERKQQRQD